MRQPLKETFARQVTAARLRLDGLFQRAGENPQAQPLVAEALEELCTALEELRVTAEELNAQNDEIAATRGLADTQRQNYQELFEFAPDPYLVTDTNGVIQQANRKAAALFGVRQDFIRGKPIMLFFPAQRRPECRRMLLNLTRNDAANELETEMEIRPRDAAAIPVAVKLAVVRQSLPSGWRPIGIRWIVHDISARKRSEAQIKSQLQRLTILGAINEAITSSLDLDTVIEVLFDKLQEFFPYAIVTTVRLFHPDTRELQPLFCRNIDAIGWKAAGLQEAGPRATECIESRKPLVIADLSSDPRTVRGEFYRKNGLESAVTVPLLLQDDVLGILSVYSKTRREFAAEEIELLASVGQQAAIAIQNSRFYDKVKRQSTEVQHAHDRLEEKVEERTVELAKINEILRAEIDARRKIEELLRQSERKLRALTQEQEQQLIASDRLVSVGELAASIAHEFNNPLQIIMGFAQELLDEEKAGPRYDGLKIIEAETVRCRELIRNLMNFARPQSAKPEATEVEPVIANATRLALHYLMKSKVRLQTEIAPYLPAIRADANQLQQVLINLLFNAAEAMPEGGEVKVGAALSGDHTVVISIADTGVGISASALPHIFRPFFTTKQKKGMGLGLSICERIVRSHGGRIAVESAPDKGTTFHLHFPIAEENYERAS